MSQAGCTGLPPPRCPERSGHSSECSAYAMRTVRQLPTPNHLTHKQCWNSLLVSQKQEDELLEELESICDPDTDAGDWITHFDLQEKGSKLELVPMGKVSSGLYILQYAEQ